MKKSILQQLLGFMRPHWVNITLATISSTLNKLCDIAPEILIGLSIDTVVNQEHSILSNVGISNPFYQLYIIATITGLLWALESVFEYFYLILWRSVAQSIQQEIRITTYNHLQNIDNAYYEDKTIGGLVAILNDDINDLEIFLAEIPNAIIQLAANIIIMGVIFFYFSPKIAVLTIIPIPVVIAISYYFQRHLAILYGIVRERSGSLTGHIASRLMGINTIKSYTSQQYELDQLRTESDYYRYASYKANTLNAAYIPIVRMGIMVGFIMSLLVGGIHALSGYLAISWYAALVFLTQRFLWPFTSLSNITDMYERLMASMRRICAILNHETSIVDGQNQLYPETIRGTISLQNISFSYPSGKRIFKDLSLQIPAKNTVAFVGATGSGKSTLTKLLLRFYDASSGTIFIDGIDCKSLHLDSLRKTIGLVSQDTYLIDGTIADNIRYGTFHATYDEIKAAAQLAQAHEFIMQLPNGYNTNVGENGKNLSGGQRQRISIARALLKNPPILIFDEATSSVDNETEAAIQKSFALLSHQHTIIIIAHRLSTVRHADTIFVMDKGTIVESGSHNELLARDGAYASLWNIQTGEAS